MVELGTSVLIFKTKPKNEKKKIPELTTKIKPTKPDRPQMVSGSERSWCCTPCCIWGFVGRMAS